MSDKEQAKHTDVNVYAYDMDGELEVQCSCGERLTTHAEGRTELRLLEIMAMHTAHLVKVLS